MMKPEELQAFLETSVSHIKRSSHYKGCEEDHGWCAVNLLATRFGIVFNLIEKMAETHTPVFQNAGRIGDINCCAGCKGPTGTLINTWPCNIVVLSEMLTSAQ